MNMPLSNLASSLARGYERLLAAVTENPGWVAFSGGVDSTLVMRAACEVNSPQVVALFADSPLQSESDRDFVKQLADQLRFPLRIVSFDPLADSAFCVNTADRCYLCKRSIFSQVQSLLPSGFVLFDGTNHDDLEQDRPGHRAVLELGVVSPLASARLSKSEVRQLARWLGLPNWSRPSSSCLATRIPRGLAITNNDLRRIEDYERLVRKYGFKHIRVRLVAQRPDDLIVELAREDIDCEDVFPQLKMIVEDLKRMVNGGEVCFIGREGVFRGKFD